MKINGQVKKISSSSEKMSESTTYQKLRKLLRGFNIIEGVLQNYKQIIKDSILEPSLTRNPQMTEVLEKKIQDYDDVMKDLINSLKEQLLGLLYDFGTDEELQTDLLLDLHIRHPQVVEAMLNMNRGNFCPRPDKKSKFSDRPCPLDYDDIDAKGATLSAPHIHSMSLDLIQDRWDEINYIPDETTRILDAGSGSGYMALALSNLTKNKARVIGIELVPDLVRWSLSVIDKERPDLLEDGKIIIKQGDAWKGDEKNGPYIAIYVGAAAATVPKALIHQLALGGRMVIPVGGKGGKQFLRVIDKDEDGNVTEETVSAVSFVPLIGGD